MNTTVKDTLKRRLSAERLRRHWSQLEVADQIGTTPGNVSRWERGVTSPGPYFRTKLCELFGMSARELGLAWDASDDLPSQVPTASDVMALLPWNVLAQCDSFLTGREDLLAKLDAISAISSSDGLNSPGQESLDQGRLAQAIALWLQVHPNWVLILDNAEAVVLVALKNNVSTRPSSLN